MTCPTCGSEALAMLGTLGNLAWLRCMACGMDCSVDAQALPAEEQEASDD